MIYFLIYISFLTGAVMPQFIGSIEQNNSRDERAVAPHERRKNVTKKHHILAKKSVYF